MAVVWSMVCLSLRHDLMRSSPAESQTAFLGIQLLTYEELWGLMIKWSKLILTLQISEIHWVSGCPGSLQAWTMNYNVPGFNPARDLGYMLFTMGIVLPFCL